MGTDKYHPRSNRPSPRGFRAGCAPLQDQYTKKYDADGDGQLSDAERQTMLQGIQQDLQDRRKKYDANGDGTLDAAETAKMTDDLQKEFMGDN